MEAQSSPGPYSSVPEEGLDLSWFPDRPSDLLLSLGPFPPLDLLSEDLLLSLFPSPLEGVEPLLKGGGVGDVWLFP